jgi:hypothetical protein
LVIKADPTWSRPGPLVISGMMDEEGKGMIVCQGKVIV